MYPSGVPDITTPISHHRVHFTEPPLPTSAPWRATSTPPPWVAAPVAPLLDIPLDAPGGASAADNCRLLATELILFSFGSLGAKVDNGKSFCRKNREKI